jgi:hypothetical protein
VFRDLKIARTIIVATSMLSWFAASNHCVLAAPPVKHVAMGQSGMSSGCPMHTKQQRSQPEKQNGCGDLPCCKNLRATTTAAAKLVASPVWLGALITFYTPAEAEATAAAARTSCFLDRGPPGESSFAELVLQRSILAHAPPVLLS